MNMKLNKTRTELNALMARCGLAEIPELSEEDTLVAVRNAVAYAGHRSGERSKENDFYRTSFLELLDGIFN